MAENKIEETDKEVAEKLTKKVDVSIAEEEDFDDEDELGEKDLDEIEEE